MLSALAVIDADLVLHQLAIVCGYPEGLSGDAIPISARLMAVADVYDALVSRRVYKSPMPHDYAVKVMLEGRAQHFDPDMIDAFIACQEQFKMIGEKYADSETDLLKKAQITG